MGPSSTTTKQQVVLPPPSQQELDLQAQQQAINSLNLQTQGYTLERQPDGTYKAVTLPATPEQQRQQDLNNQIQNYIAQRITGNVMLTPEQQQQINTLYGAQRTLGTQSIDQFARELAGARGLSTGDTPVARQALFAKTNLETGLGGAQAGATLDYSSAQQQFAAAQQQFQNALQQQAFLNRNLSGQNIEQMAAGLTQQRFRQPTTTATVTNNPGLFGTLFGVGQALGGLGQAASGLGGLNLFASKSGAPTTP